MRERMAAAQYHLQRVARGSGAAPRSGARLLHDLCRSLLDQIHEHSLTAGAFALVVKVLPDVNIAWRDVWLATALVLLAIGRGGWRVGLVFGLGHALFAGTLLVNIVLPVRAVGTSRGA